MKTLRQITKIAERFTVDNAPTLMTGLGVAGVLTTAVLAAKASFEASDLLRAEIMHRETMLVHNGELPAETVEHEVDGLPVRVLKKPEFTRKDAFKLVWKLYIPAVVTGTITVVAIVGANRVGMRRYAAMAAAYSLSETALVEYKDKVVEHIGREKDEKIREELAQKQLEKIDGLDKEIVIMGSGEHLFLDSFSGRTFKSDIETLRRIENDFNHDIITGFGETKLLSELYSEIGLKPTDYSSEVGWNLDNKLEFNITSTIYEGVPVGVLGYASWPIREYSNRS